MQCRGLCCLYRLLPACLIVGRAIGHTTDCSADEEAVRLGYCDQLDASSILLQAKSSVTRVHSSGGNFELEHKGGVICADQVVDVSTILDRMEADTIVNRLMSRLPMYGLLMLIARNSPERFREEALTIVRRSSPIDLEDDFKSDARPSGDTALASTIGEEHHHSHGTAIPQNQSHHQVENTTATVANYERPVHDIARPEKKEWYEKHYKVLLIQVSAMIFLLLIVALVSKLCSQDGGSVEIPEKTSELEHPDMWLNNDKLVKFVNGHVAIQELADFRQMSMLLNRPWLAKPGGFFFGKPEPLTPNKEWMGNRLFPNGETRQDSVVPMVIALWRFMIRCYGCNAKWCIFYTIVKGLNGPLQAMCISWLLDELQGGAPRIPYILVLSLMLLIAGSATSLASWRHEMDLPAGDVEREMTLRMQSQFVHMSGDIARAWPEGRCAAIMDVDLPSVVWKTWLALFTVVEVSTNITATVVVELMNGMLQRGAPCIWEMVANLALYVTLLLGAAFDLRLRAPILIDLACRVRQWIHCESALSSWQIEASREGKTRRADLCHKELEEVTFCLLYREAHNCCAALAVAIKQDWVNNMVLTLVFFISATGIANGYLSPGQGLGQILLVRIVCTAIKDLNTVVVLIYQSFPALQAVSDVFNLEVEGSCT